MLTSIAQIVAALVSLATLAWAIITQARTFSGRKHAERAETAARLLATLEQIGVGGMSPRLADSLALKLHASQVQGLQEVIRVNTAEFERQAKRTGIPMPFHVLIGMYGILVLVVASLMINDVARIQSDQRWIGVLVVVGFYVGAAVMILDFVFAASRRATSRTARRRAGIYVPSLLEILSTGYVAIRRWRQKRRGSRDQSGPVIS